MGNSNNGSSNTALATRQNNGDGTGIAQLEQVLVQGDLKSLSENERIMYVKAVCESIGLNPLTKPFDYITLNGKLTLYAKKDATDQLRMIHNVSISNLTGERVDDVYVVRATATIPGGRTDTSTGVVSIAGLKGDMLANALMKAETKAKRRVTLSICGLGLLDETEAETVGGAVVSVSRAVNPDTGEILEREANAETKPETNWEKFARYVTTKLAGLGCSDRLIHELVDQVGAGLVEADLDNDSGTLNALWQKVKAWERSAEAKAYLESIRPGGGGLKQPQQRQDQQQVTIYPEKEITWAKAGDQNRKAEAGNSIFNEEQEEIEPSALAF